MEQQLTFRRFPTAMQAIEVINLLQEHNIPATYEEEVVMMDKIYIGQNFDQRHVVKIPASCFNQADTLLRKRITVVPEDVEPDYYLLSFTTAELKEVIEKKDEWGEFDYALATALLERQGISYTPEQLDALGGSRKEELSKPQELSATWLVVGFLSPLVIFGPFPVFGFLGIFMGAFVCLTKKTLPDGTRVKAFSAKTQDRGKLLIVSGILGILVCGLVVYSLTH